MTYSFKVLENKSLKLIREKKLTFIEDLVCYLPCSKTTFYAKNLNDSDILKDAILINKQIIKQALRLKWLKSENATTEIALYKLLGTEEERKVLNNNKIELINPKGEVFKVEDSEKIKDLQTQVVELKGLRENAGEIRKGNKAGEETIS